MSKDIHWYPGHMKKASIQIQNKLKLVDCIIELLDARIPYSSRNKELYNLTKSKNRLIVLTKSDLADPIISKSWLDFFNEQGFATIFADLNNNKDVQRIIRCAESNSSKKQQIYLDKGMKKQPIRAMIVGIPNVGKSTLINKIAKRKAAGVENKPGFTKAQQWIKVSDQFELLDTPGILQSNYDDKSKALNLALCGSINENILPTDYLANELLNYLKQYYPDALMNRYKLTSLNKDNIEILTEIAKNRGLLLKSYSDISKAEILLLNEFKNGKLGRISLEREKRCL